MNNKIILLFGDISNKENELYNNISKYFSDCTVIQQNKRIGISKENYLNKVTSVIDNFDSNNVVLISYKKEKIVEKLNHYYGFNTLYINCTEIPETVKNKVVIVHNDCISNNNIKQLFPHIKTLLE